MKKDPNKYTVSNEKKMISLLFPVLSPIFSLPEQIPLDPSENETLLFFASSEKSL